MTSTIRGSSSFHTSGCNVKWDISTPNDLHSVVFAILDEYNSPFVTVFVDEHQLVELKNKLDQFFAEQGGQKK